MQNNEKVEVIILGANYANALGMVKSVGEAGYNVGLIHHTSILEKKRLTADMASHYVVKGKYVDKKNDEAMLDALMNDFRDDENKIVVIAADDFSASFLDRYYDELCPYFRVLQWESGKGALTSFTDKENQKKAAVKVGFPVAQCWSIKVPEPGMPAELPEGIIYPCITKPEVSAGNGMSKELIEVIQCEEDLKAYFERVSQVAAGTILVEEFLTIDEEYTIPGARLADEVIVPCYVRKIETGKGKVRGLTVMGEVQSTDVYPELKKTIEAFVKEIGLLGIFDVEIIKCRGQYYFNEINLRSSAATYAVTGSGVNIPGIYIDYMLGKDWKADNRIIKTGTKFINEKPALQCFVQGDYTLEKYRQLMAEADIHLLTGEGDEPSKAAFLFLENREMTKKKIGPKGVLFLKAVRRTGRRIKKFVVKKWRYLSRGIGWRVRRFFRRIKKGIRWRVRKLNREINNRWLIKLMEIGPDRSLSDISALLTATFEAAMVEDDFVFSNASDFEKSLEEIRNNGGKIFIAAYMGKLAGTISICPTQVKSWYYEGEALTIKHLAVDPKYQRKGIGRKLVRLAIASVEEGDTRPFILYTPEKNRKAIRFYRKSHFMPIRLHYATDHYSVNLVRWHGERLYSKKERIFGYRRSAMMTLLKNGVNEAADLGSGMLRRMWKKQIAPYREGADAVRIEDMLECYREYEITPQEYALYHFEEKNREDREAYIPYSCAIRSYKKLVGPSENRIILRNRFKTYSVLKSFYKRDMEEVETIEGMAAFAEAHPRFELRRTAVTNEKSIIRVKMDQRRRSMKKLYGKTAAKRKYVMVESVEQHEFMNQFHPKFMNSVRIVTCNEDDQIRTAFALLRAGRGKSWRRNVYSGDLYAAIDPNTGVVTTDAYRRNDGMVYPEHPKTGAAFKKTKLPEWRQAMALVTKAARQFEDIAIIGWDLVYGENGWVIADVRLKPSLREIQMVNGKGIRERMETLTGDDFAPTDILR